MTEAGTDGERQNVATQWASLRTSPEPIGLFGFSKSPPNRTQFNFLAGCWSNVPHHRPNFKEVQQLHVYEMRKEPTWRFLAVVKPCPTTATSRGFKYVNFPPIHLKRVLRPHIVGAAWGQL
jgi:hypothetical protein